ncbi:hypothetical protein B0O80DRAFT_145818 [Mortierella sp. GBAus27b]|nr:hypothetical protein B0O80DRAFT_145818 [Mortierella sp. GBAus27b]
MTASTLHATIKVNITYQYSLTPCSHSVSAQTFSATQLSVSSPLTSSHQSVQPLLRPPHVTELLHHGDIVMSGRRRIDLTHSLSSSGLRKQSTAPRMKRDLDFNSITASRLTFWKVTLTKDDESPVLPDSLNDKETLVPATHLSNVLTEGLAKVINSLWTCTREISPSSSQKWTSPKTFQAPHFSTEPLPLPPFPLLHCLATYTFSHPLSFLFSLSLFAFPSSHSLSPTRSFHNHHPSPFFSMMLHNTLTDKQLTLFCLVEGEATSNAFSVKIPASDTIDGLKKLIKAEKAPRFDDIAADELTLWKVCIAIPDDEEIHILLDRLNEKKKLGPADELSDVFGEKPPKKTIHVIVKRPPQGNADVCLLY